MGTDYVVSDVHLGAVPDATERAFVAFLRSLPGRARSLLVAGDLFDFWFEWGDVVPSRHFRTLAALADLADAGVPVTMIGGNHDAWGGRFLRERVGLDFRDGPIRLRLGGRAALVAHGDGVGGGDLKYRTLKAAIRSRGAIAAFRALHPELGLRLARAVSSTEAKGPAGGGVGRAAYIRAWAEARLAEESELSLVVCGHAHRAEITEVAPGRHYVNAGDWLREAAYVTVPDGAAPALRRWEE